MFPKKRSASTSALQPGNGNRPGEQSGTEEKSSSSDDKRSSSSKGFNWLDKDKRKSQQQEKKRKKQTSTEEESDEIALGTRTSGSLSSHYRQVEASLHEESESQYESDYSSSSLSAEKKDKKKKSAKPIDNLQTSVRALQRTVDSQHKEIVRLRELVEAQAGAGNTATTVPRGNVKSLSDLFEKKTGAGFKNDRPLQPQPQKSQDDEDEDDLSYDEYYVCCGWKWLSTG